MVYSFPSLNEFDSATSYGTIAILFSLSMEHVFATMIDRFECELFPKILTLNWDDLVYL